MQVNDVKKVAVFGAGTMGPGLALVFALGGYEVALYSRKQETLDKAMMVARESLPPSSITAASPWPRPTGRWRMIHPTQSVEEAGREADFVMETIAENKDAKSALYAELDTICPEHTVFASNTSSLNVFELVPRGAAAPHRGRALLRPGAHHPAGRSGPRSADRPGHPGLHRRLPRRLRQDPGDHEEVRPGLHRQPHPAGHRRDLHGHGAGRAGGARGDRQAIKATLGIRLPIVGVMQTFDFQGLDMLLAYQKNVGKVYSFVEERVERGALGAKTSKGIYDYQGRSEAEILKKRDELYLKMIDYLTEIGAFEPV